MMRRGRGFKVRIGWMWLTAPGAHRQPFTVATVGDSFADSQYNEMRSRPDLLGGNTSLAGISNRATNTSLAPDVSDPLK